MRTSGCLALLTTMLVVPAVMAAAEEAPITPPPAAWTQAKRSTVSWLDDHQDLLQELSRTLWQLAEPGLLEYRSSALLADVLEEHDFVVERGVAGMPTAFTARYGSQPPVLGILAEYDALGGLSQEVTTQPRPVVKGGPGHGCGHNLYSAGSVGAAIAVAKAIAAGEVKGSVILFGTPNEEGVTGKPYMARAGLFDGLDACLHWHPGDKNVVATGEETSDLNSFMVVFRGRTAHAAWAPWKGRSAADAVELMGVMANYYREHLHPSCRIHYVMLEAGKAPNVVPDFAKAWFFLRGGTRELVDEMFERMQKIAAAAAMATDTEHQLRLYTAINHVRNSTEGARIVHANLQLIGAPQFSDEEQAFARSIQHTMGWDEQGLTSDIEPLAAPRTRDLESFIGAGSTDVAEVSLITPTAGLRVATFVLDTPGHHWANAACAGHSIGERGMMVAAKVLAASAIDMLEQPQRLQIMRRQLDESTGGQPYVSSIPEDTQPPVLPDPYRNPDWEPGDLDYPSWSSFAPAPTGLGPATPPGE